MNCKMWIDDDRWYCFLLCRAVLDYNRVKVYRNLYVKWSGIFHKVIGHIYEFERKKAAENYWLSNWHRKFNVINLGPKKEMKWSETGNLEHMLQLLVSCLHLFFVLFFWLWLLLLRWYFLEME